MVEEENANVAVEEEQQLDESIEMLYGALQRLDTEPDNEELLEWCKNICRPEYAIVDGLVANFVASYTEKRYADKILKVLK